MRRLIHGLIAALPAVPLGLVAVLAGAPAAQAEDNGVGLTPAQADVSVNGGTAQLVQFTPAGSFAAVGTMTVPLTLAARTNTIEFSNPSAYAPDFDRIIVAAAPS